MNKKDVLMALNILLVVPYGIISVYLIILFTSRDSNSSDKDIIAWYIALFIAISAILILRLFLNSTIKLFRGYYHRPTQTKAICIFLFLIGIVDFLVVTHFKDLGTAGVLKFVYFNFIGILNAIFTFKAHDEIRSNNSFKMIAINLSNGELKYDKEFFSQDSTLDYLKNIFLPTEFELRRTKENWSSYRLSISDELIFRLFFFDEKIRVIEIYPKNNNVEDGDRSLHLLKSLGGAHSYFWGEIVLNNDQNGGNKSVIIRYR